MIRRRRRFATAATLGIVALTGLACDQPTGSTRPRSQTATADPTPAPAAATPDPAPEPVKPRPILGQQTQDIRDPTVEAKKGGVQTTPRITAKDPIMLTGNAYVTVVGQASILKIQHDLDLYQGLNGDYPKTREEFMEKVIKENGTRLPLLPFYQEYGYDVPNHRLIILEYPDRKTEANYPKNP